MGRGRVWIKGKFRGMCRSTYKGIGRGRVVLR